MAIQRRGSFLYAKAWRNLVALSLLVWITAGAAVALLVWRAFDRALIAAIIAASALTAVCAVWITYRIVVWAFSREARQVVEIGSGGIRETREGREQAFIPFSGIREIEVASTFPAGASLRVKSDFSEIAFSNVDLVVDDSMTLGQMHASLAETDQMRDLLASLKQSAPQAQVSLKGIGRRLARKGGFDVKE